MTENTDNVLLPPIRYPGAMRLLHWLMALLILGMIGAGWYMAELPGSDPLRYKLVMLHKSLGITLLALFFIRLSVRLRSTIPPLPTGLPEREIKLAHAAHGLLYLLMFLVPFSGYVMSSAGKYGVQWFGIALPDLFGKSKVLSKFAHEMHGILPYILLGIIALHVAGVIKHRVFDKPENDVLKRML